MNHHRARKNYEIQLHFRQSSRKPPVLDLQTSAFKHQAPRLGVWGKSANERQVLIKEIFHKRNIKVTAAYVTLIAQSDGSF